MSSVNNGSAVSEPADLQFPHEPNVANVSDILELVYL